MSFFTKDEITKDYDKLMENWVDEYVAISYSVSDKEFFVSNKTSFSKLLRVVFGLKKINKMKVNPKNNRNITIGEKTWYCFVLQEVGIDYYDPDPFGCLMLGFQVGGVIYACKNESDRDNFVNKMNGNLGHGCQQCKSL